MGVSIQKIRVQDTIYDEKQNVFDLFSAKDIINNLQLFEINVLL